LNIPLDSSNRYVASEGIPFVGMVLHGSKTFSGEAINLAGDYTYSLLKTIENGATPYFILSYQNANALKTSETYSKYYSIRYDIWKNDLIETYQTLDMILAPVKNSKIANHEFVNSRHVIVTYENGVTYEIDYSASTIIVNDGKTSYFVDFEPRLVEDNHRGYALSEYDNTEYKVPTVSGESTTVVVENSKAYSIKDFLTEKGYEVYYKNAENN
jgi:hypothetical protein